MDVQCFNLCLSCPEAEQNAILRIYQSSAIHILPDGVYCQFTHKSHLRHRRLLKIDEGCTSHL